MSKNPFVRVKSLREHKGWTQSDLARESGVDQANISRLEAGKTPNVSAVLLGQLADTLGTTVDYLLGLTDDPAPPPNPSAISRVERLARDEDFMAFVEFWEAMSEEAHKTFIAMAKHLVEHQSE